MGLYQKTRRLLEEQAHLVSQQLHHRSVVAQLSAGDLHLGQRLLLVHLRSDNHRWSNLLLEHLASHLRLVAAEAQLLGQEARALRLASRLQESLLSVKQQQLSRLQHSDSHP